MDKLNIYTSDEENQNKENSNTELAPRVTPIDNGPFSVVSKSGKSFMAFGKYRITEMYETEDEACKAMEKDFWYVLLNLITLIVEIEKKKDITQDTMK